MTLFANSRSAAALAALRREKLGGGGEPSGRLLLAQSLITS